MTKGRPDDPSGVPGAVPVDYTLSMLDRIFPESIFPRRLSQEAKGRLRLAQARAEEAVLRTHVDNVLVFIDTLAGDLSFQRAIDSYIRVMGITEPLSGMIATRVLVVLGEDLVTPRRRSRDSDLVPAREDPRPRLRLNDPETAGREARAMRALERPAENRK